MASLSDHIRKFFHKSKVIRILEYCADTKVRDHYKLPVGNEIVIGKNRFKFAPEHLYILNKIPTLFVNTASDNAEPIRAFQTHDPIYPASVFETAINNTVVSSFVAATKEKSTTAYLYIGIGILALAVAVYIIINRLDKLQEVIETPTQPVETAFKLLLTFWR